MAASIRARLVRHWLWRLRRHAELCAIDRAVTLGVVDRVRSGPGPTVFNIGERVRGWAVDRVHLLMRQTLGIQYGGLHRDPEVDEYGEETDILDDDAEWSDSPDESDAGQEVAATGDAHDEAVSLLLEDRSETVPTTALDVPPAATTRATSRVRNRGTRQGLDRASLLRTVRTYATPPAASSVAAMLMLSDAIERSGRDLADVLAILKRPRPIIVVTGAAKGFEAAFLDLLKLGFILPGQSSLKNGYELRSARQLCVTDGFRRVFIHFPGRDMEGEGREIVDQQIGLATQIGCPILATAEHQNHVPEALLDAAELRLDCTPVTPGLIIETMNVVLGSKAYRGAQGREALSQLSDNSAVDIVDFDEEAARRHLVGCDLLTLSDLALGLRPGMAPERCIELLGSLIARRQSEQNAPQDRSRKSKSSSVSASAAASRRERVGSGTTLVRPEPADASNGQTPLTVETLSGYGEARDWALALKQDLALWQQGSLGWTAMSTRVLLAGPPGTGKTLFARALGNTLELPLLATSVSTWLEPSHLGDVLTRMAAAFAEAQSNAPCLLFIDEIDGIGRRRDDRGEFGDYWNAVVNRALELLDGAVRTEGVILIGATNRPSAIDAALLRSGRLETRIDIPMPDIDALVGILDYHLGRDLEDVVASARDDEEAAVEQTVPNPTTPPAGSSPEVTHRLARLLGLAGRFRLTRDRQVTEPDDLRTPRPDDKIANDPLEAR